MSSISFCAVRLPLRPLPRWAPGAHPCPHLPRGPSKERPLRAAWLDGQRPPAGFAGSVCRFLLISRLGACTRFFHRMGLSWPATLLGQSDQALVVHTQLFELGFTQFLDIDEPIRRPVECCHHLVELQLNSQ